MKKQTILIGFLVFTVFAQAQELPQPGRDPELDAIHGKLAQLSERVDGLRAAIEIKVKDESVKFPEYTGVLNAFYERSRKTTAAFAARMNVIEETIETILSKEYSELAAVKKLYGEQPMRPTKKLLEEKELRLRAAKAELQKEIQTAYGIAMTDLLSNGGLLFFPVRLTFNANQLFWLVPVAFLVSNVGDHMDYWHASIQDNFKRPLKDFIPDHSNFYSSRSEARASIFSGCKTAGCALLMNEYFKDWLAQASEVNQSVDLMDGLKLSKIKFVRVKKQKRVLDRMSEDRASELPIGVFSEEGK